MIHIKTIICHGENYTIVAWYGFTKIVILVDKWKQTDTKKKKKNWEVALL